MTVNFGLSNYLSNATQVTNGLLHAIIQAACKQHGRQNLHFAVALLFVVLLLLLLLLVHLLLFLHGV